MSEKKQVLQLIEDMPDDVTLEEMLRELYIYMRFQRGVQEDSEKRRNKIGKKNIDPTLH